MMSTLKIQGRPLQRVFQNILYKGPRYIPQRQAVYSPLYYLSTFNQHIHTASDTAKLHKVVAGIAPTLLEAKHTHFGRWDTDSQSLTDFVRFRSSVNSEPVIALRSWLRDACGCPRCVDSSSGQKHYASTDVPDKLHIRTLAVNEKGALGVFWEDDFLTHDTHFSEYPFDFWREAARSPRKRRELTEWTQASLTQASPYFPHASFMKGGNEYRDAVTALGALGIIFIRGVPRSEESVKELAARIGFIQETFYGPTWDVVSKPMAENVAYTNSYLGLHQDLLYMENVPRIQLLHCLENSCDGGESLFSDGRHAAHQFYRKFPELVGHLTTRSVAYHYNKGGNRYERSHPVLGEDGVTWSPPFQRPVQYDEMTAESMANYSQWLHAARKLRALFEDPANIYEYKMQPGDCVIFDNRRVLHGRRSFNTSSGKRWLKGTYVECSSYGSLLRSFGLGGE